MIEGPAITKLYESLRPETIKEAFQKHLITPPINQDRIEQIDHERCSYKYHEYDAEENISLIEEYFFDDTFVQHLKDYIKDVVTEIRLMKSYEGLSVTQINNNLRNIKFELDKKYTLLYQSELFIPKTLNHLNGFIKNLIGQLVPKSFRRQENKLINLQFSQIKDPAEMIHAVFDFLVRKGSLEASSRDSFVSFFTNKWNQQQIEWKGTAREFGAFYKALFFNLDSLGDKLITFKGSKPKLLLNAFIVKDDKEVRLIPATLRPSITKINKSPFYNEFVSEILNWV